METKFESDIGIIEVEGGQSLTYAFPKLIKNEKDTVTIQINNQKTDDFLMYDQSNIYLEP